jgi:hypothetical protein
MGSTLKLYWEEHFECAKYNAVADIFNSCGDVYAIVWAVMPYSLFEVYCNLINLITSCCPASLTLYEGCVVLRNVWNELAYSGVE